jgi:hypothetical protein
MYAVIRKHIEGILAYVSTGLSNGRAEGLNGKIRVITRRSYGFHDPASLISLLFLCCSLSPVLTIPVHGFRRTFNNLPRQVASGEVVRSMTGHVTERMTEHYSHVSH